MKVHIIQDEMYPVYFLVKPSSRGAIVLDLPEELVEELKRTEKAYVSIQDRIEEYIKK